MPRRGPGRSQTLRTVPPRNNVMHPLASVQEDRRRELRVTVARLTASEENLQAALDDRHVVSHLTAKLDSQTSEASATGAFRIAAKIQQRLHSAVARAQRQLSRLFDQEWMVQALFACAIGGAASYGISQLFSSATETATNFVREVSKLADVVNNVTRLIMMSSAEATLWVAGILGGAMGASAGMLLSALLPGGPGLVLGTAALGAYSGFTLLDDRPAIGKGRYREE